jgi:hypothetical protein
MKAVDISVENANSLRERTRQSQEAYVAFNEAQKKMTKRYSELAGPMGPGEIAVLREESNRMEVVPHPEYLDDLHRVNWY